jgi:hypothetical protein
MNLTKTIHKTPVDANLVRQGWTEQEKARIQPKYDRDYAWVSELWRPSDCLTDTDWLADWGARTHACVCA